MRNKPKSREYRDGSPAAYSHLKLDGNFTRIIRYDDGSVRAFSSQNTDLTEKLPARLLTNVWRFVPNNTILLGELYVPGRKASYVKSAIKDDPNALRLLFFAVETAPVEESLEDVDALVSLWGLPFASYRRLPAEWSPCEELEWGLENGGEGVVYKDANLLNWQKHKPFHTIDLIVDGFTEGDGKYIGQIGSLICKTVEGYVVANVSGMDDDIRQEISDDEARFLGRVVEVSYQYVGEKGRLRHPAFVGWRGDKTPVECMVDQDPELEERWSFVRR